jgi:hypothetical protein
MTRRTEPLEPLVQSTEPLGMCMNRMTVPVEE